MLGAFSLVSALIAQPSPSATSQRLLEAVDAAAAVAAPFFTGQDYVGFNPGAPAMVGGFVRQDDTLAWPLRFPTTHYAQMFFGAQKNSFAYNVIITDSNDAVVYRSEKAAKTHDVSFQPQANKDYLLVIEPQKAPGMRRAEIVGILAVIGRGLQLKPSIFTSTARRLVRESQPLLTSGGYVDGMNLFAVPLAAGASSGPEACEAGRTQVRNSMVVVSDGRASSFSAVLRTPDGALAGAARKLGSAKALKITVDANANGHPGAPLHLTNTSKASSLFVGGIINR